MSNVNTRDVIQEHCILVKGFTGGAGNNAFQNIFPQAVRFAVVGRTSTHHPVEQEWIVQFRSTQDSKHYVEMKRLERPEGILEINPCQPSCDIPNEWLQGPQPPSEADNPPPYTAVHGEQNPYHPSGGQYDQQGPYPYPYMQYPGPHQQHMFQNPGQFGGFQRPPGPNPPSRDNVNNPPGPWPRQPFYPYGPYQGYPYPGYPGFDPNNPQAHNFGPYQHGPTGPGPQQQGGHGYESGPHPGGPYYAEQPGPGSAEHPSPSPSGDNQPVDATASYDTNDVTEGHDDPPEEPEEPKTNMLKVTKLPPGTTVDFLECFFENTRKYGGGDVQDVDLDEETHSAIITFEEDEAVENVLKKLPIMFNKKVIEVEPYGLDTVEDKDPEEVNIEDTEETEEVPSYTIEVSGVKENTPQDTVMYYFESRKGARAEVTNIEFVEEKNVYLVTFKNEEAVTTVVNKSHILDGTTLTVKKHVPPKKYSNKVLIKNLNSKTTKENIINFVEARTKLDVEEVDIGDEDSGKAIVTFDESIGSKSNDASHPDYVPSVEMGYKKKTNVEISMGRFQRLEQRQGEKQKCDAASALIDLSNTENILPTPNVEPDFSSIQTAIKERPLDKNYLTVHPVFVTNCIVVRGFSEKTTQSSLEYYFDNKKKSGVEGVTDVNMNTEENYCTIYFENPEDALNACKKSHIIEGSEVKVQVFYDCLGVPADTDGPKFKPRPPMKVTDIDKYLFGFISNSGTARKEFEDKLSKEYGKIQWPSSNKDTTLTIECTLDKDVPNCKQLAKNWENSIEKQIKSFLEPLKVEKLSTLQEAWSAVLDGVRQIEIENPDSVALSLEKPPVCEFIVAGVSASVRDVADKIQRIITEVSEDLDKKKQTVQEEVSLKKHQLLILSFTKFPDEIKQKFDEMNVKIDTKHCLIKFTGLSGNISQAKVIMYETYLNQIKSVKLGKKSPGFIKFLKMQEVTIQINSKIKEKGCIGVWEIQDNFLTMYSTSDDDVITATDIIKESIVESEVKVDNLQRSSLQTAKWKQHVQSLKDEFGQKSVVVDIVTDHKGQITLFCTSKGDAGVIREKIQDFFLFNTEKEITIDLSSVELKFLEEQMKDELEKIQSDLQNKNVILAIKSDCIVVKGNHQGIKDAEGEIDQLVSKIYKIKHTIDKPGLQDLVESVDGKNKIKEVNKKAGVLVSLSTNEEQFGGQGIKSRSSADQNAFIAAGGQKVIVVKGDITGLDVDVIVNAANKDLQHSGGLAKVLVNKGGRSIQDECDRYIKSNGQLSEGECFSSGPGNMRPCQMIVHAVGPVWQGGSNREEDSLCRCVENALDDTETAGFTSIAIPALCTGIFGYPPEKATFAIMKTVKEYFKGNNSSRIQTVYLCDVNDKAVQGFDRAGNKLFGGGGSGSHDRGPSNIEIKIVKGELSKMRVKMLVNTTSKDLSLNRGAVSASLLMAGGQAIQDECTQNYPRGVNYGEAAVTSGGNLYCDYICHGCLDKYQPGGSSIKTLEKFIKACMSTADRNGCRNIAFPAMGTGVLGYPKDLVAKHMYNAVEEFASQNPRSGVNEVLFVLYEKDLQTIKAFEDEQRRRNSAHAAEPEFGEKPTGYKGRQSKKQKDTKKPDKGAHGGQKHTADSPGDSKQYSVDLGSVVLKIYQGDITDAKVDAIVNGTNPDLDFSVGAVAKAISKKGGKELSGQLKSKVAEMQSKGICVTDHKPGGQLACCHVIHVDMAVGGPLDKKLKDKVKQILDKAEEIKVSKVALPALGTSNANIPVSQAAENMFTMVENFNNSSPSHVKEVHVVIYQTTMMNEFMDAIKTCVKKNPKGYMEKFFGWTGLVGGAAKKDIKVTSVRANRSFQKAQVAVDKQSFTVHFSIFARNKSSADHAISLLEQMVQDAYMEKVITARILKEFKQQQIDDAKNKLEMGGKIEVNIDTTKGEIKLKGMKRQISDAVNLANMIISQAEKEKQQGQKAKIVKDLAQWYFMDKDDKGKDKIVEYPEDVNLILETAFRDQKKQATFCDSDGDRYIVDLDDLEEYPAGNPKDKVAVLRKSKLTDKSIALPASWDMMDEKQNLKKVELKPSSKEYQNVTKQFLATAGTNVNFVKVERIQNKTLYQQFVAKKKLMDDTNPKTVQNERPLWHGFSVDALDSICNYGFNRSYCGKNATAYGAGVYFAVNVNYSMQGAYSRPDGSGHKRIFLCRVLTGESTQGNSNMRVPPNKPSAAGSHILYDSVTGPGMFVIFHDSQAYPEYLFTFIL